MGQQEQLISVEYSENKKTKPDPRELAFGKLFTDHMLIIDYTEKQGWHDAKIVPYQPLEIDPAAMVFHYGQSVFEGMKAYLNSNKDPVLFRPTENLRRLNRSNQRLCIPEIDEAFALKGIKQLIHIEKEWIPDMAGTSLYVRPFIISTEAFLGVAPSKHYQFIVILSPVGAYYKEGINPIGIMVENEYVRAVAGGTGEAKTGGNYASSLKAQEIAGKDGFAQVLWLDGVERKYVEEVGSMNVFFKIDGKVITPELNGSILPGITRDTTLQLLKSWDVPIETRHITIDEIFDAHRNGTLEEAFGTGTAAVISPIGKLAWNDQEITINQNQTGEVSKKLYDTITSIQYGQSADLFNWVEKVDTAVYV